MSTTTSEQDHPTLVVIDREYQRLNEVLDNLSPEAMERAGSILNSGALPGR